MQYHFGSKQGLLASIVEFHRTAIDDHRRELLEEREVEGRGEQLSALIEILVAPLAPKLDDPSRQAYLRIQAQGLSTETLHPATRTVVQRIGQSLDAIEGDGRDPYRGRFASSFSSTLWPIARDRKRTDAHSAQIGAHSPPPSSEHSKSSSPHQPKPSAFTPSDTDQGSSPLRSTRKLDFIVRTSSPLELRMQVRLVTIPNPGREIDVRLSR